MFVINETIKHLYVSVVLMKIISLTISKNKNLRWKWSVTQSTMDINYETTARVTYKIC